MKLSKPVKIVIGVFTAGEVLFPLLAIASYFLFILFAASSEFSNSSTPENVFLPMFFFFMFIIFCGGFIQFTLQVFYLVHVIVNKSGNDVLKIVLGLLAFFVSPIGMPIYYFVYIWPENPPSWAQSSTSESTVIPSSTL